MESRLRQRNTGGEVSVQIDPTSPRLPAWEDEEIISMKFAVIFAVAGVVLSFALGLYLLYWSPWSLVGPPLGVALMAFGPPISFLPLFVIWVGESIKRLLIFIGVMLVYIIGAAFFLSYRVAQW
eukprot:TRINITY_DN15453_c0_g1_i1.p2 TRINITY_DN15453_c0_g1~~TRINITY_DN15453_c0_g1_i1.p2  ORF type:complete len:124 (+),score=28.58 TRINITY_DN15453_c0_g1_i1:97-468(+)